MNAARHRIADIECLRGVAVIMVIAYHARTGLFSWPMPMWDRMDANYFQTWPGVDLFFAISGFVIARSLLPELAGSTFPVRTMAAFWVRRFWRLVPSAWTWLAIILLASVVFNRSNAFDTLHTNFESALAGMLSIANFREAAAFQRFPYGPSSPYWSLSLEEQFYLVLPILAWLAGRWLVPALLAITAVVFILPYEPWVMMIRVHAVLLGVLLAIASSQRDYAIFSPRFMRGRPLAGLALLGFTVSVIGALAPFGQRITAYPLDFIALLSALLVFVASQNENLLIGYRPMRVVLVWVGTRSYALYLVHVPVFCATREIWHRISFGGKIFDQTDLLRLTVTAVVLLLLCAELNYRLLEAPMRKHGARIALRMKHDAEAAL